MLHSFLGIFRYRPPVDMEQWSWLLVQLCEPSLHTAGGIGGASESLRVFRIRSFQPVVAVRAERWERVVRLTRIIQGRDAPERREGELPLDRWSTCIGTMGDDAFWRVPRMPAQGLDGETWLLERRTAAEYRNLASWCPGKGGRDADILANGEALLAMAAREFGVTL